MKEVAIIGGGILGLSIGYKLSRLYTKYKVTIFEKEDEVGCHQSGRNSGVLHCGLSYKPKSLKAQLAVDGTREMIKFCKDNEVSFDQCGKVVVATNNFEERYIKEIAKKGKLNGLKGLKFLNNSELSKREPFVRANKALLVPEEGIVDFKGVMLKLAKLIKEKNGSIFLKTDVNSIKNKKNKAIIRFGSKEKEFDLIINCAGLYSDRVYASLTKNKRPVRIVPFRGEYMRFKEGFNQMVNHLVYPVPNPKFPFLGVHFTRMIDGSRELGPNAVLALKREGYKNTDFSIVDSFDSITYKGLLKFISKNFKFSIGEFLSSLSKKSFINKAKKIMPEIEESMLEKGISGVRAQAMSSNGELLMDFRIEQIKNQIHLLNAPSPGATASLAIANHIILNYIESE